MISVEIELPHAFTDVSKTLEGYRQLRTETFLEEILSVKHDSGLERPLSVYCRKGPTIVYAPSPHG